MQSFRKWAAGIALALTGLTGCASREMVTLDNGYEKTRLPAHFDRNQDESDRYFSLTMGGREQQTFAFTDEDGVPFRVRNATYSADALFLLESGISHFGLQIGLSPHDQGLVRLGGFWGLTHNGQPFFTSITGGVFVNNNVNRVTYTETECLFVFCGDEEESSSGNVPHLELPLRANLMFDTRTPVSPYASYAVNVIGIGVRKGGADLASHELSMGGLVEIPGGHGFRFETSASRDGVVDRKAIEGARYTHVLYGARVAYVKKL